MVHLLKPVICLTLVMLAPGLQAGVNKGCDDQGRVHSGAKPTTAKAGEVDIKAGSGGVQTGQPASRRELQQRFLRAREAERREKQQAAEENKKKLAKAKRDCARAKKEYDKYRYDRGRDVKGKDGEAKTRGFKHGSSYVKPSAVEFPHCRH